MKPTLLIFAFSLFAGVQDPAAPALPGNRDEDPDLYEAREKLKKGDYDAAERRLTKLLKDDPAMTEALRLRAHARSLSFQFDAMREDADALIKKDAKDPAAHYLLTLWMIRKGKYEDALASAKKLEDAALPLTAKWLEVSILDEMGQFESALEKAKKASDFGFDKRPEDAHEWLSLGLTFERIGEFENASQCYTKAEKAKRVVDLNPLIAQDAIVALGNTYFHVYRNADGRPNGEKEFNEILRANPSHYGALLARYMIGRSNWQLDGAKTQNCFDTLYEADPASPILNILKAQSFIGDRRFDDARELLQKALGENPRHLETRTELAALDYLQKRNAEFDTFKTADLKERPKSSRLPRILGVYLKGLYRFGDAIPVLEEATKRDPRDGEALTALGECYAHLGREKEALVTLKKAEEAEEGLIHPWRNNMMQALEVLESKYLTVDSANFKFSFHPEAEPILRETLPAFYEYARKDYGSRYSYVPPETVKVEVLQRFDDFSNRSVGFSGFSALGVCFGPVITAVSPLTEPFRGKFSYLDTAWHEYSHVIHLALSKGRVPRWFTEGLATLEEKKRNPAFDRRMEIELLEARATNQIYPILELNSAFRGPRIIFGYYQGGLICEYLEKTTKTSGFVEALKLFAEDLPLEDVIQRAFGMSVAELDKGFLAFVDEKLKSVKVRPQLDERTMRKLRTAILKKPNDIESLRALCWAYVKRGKIADAEGYLEKLKAAAPEDGEGYLLRAELSLLRKRPDVAVEFYKKGFDAGAEEFFSRMKYANILFNAKDKDYEEVKKQLRAAISAFPEFADEEKSPRITLAKLLDGEEKFDESTKLLEELCQLNGTAFEARQQLAKRYETNKDYKNCERVLREILDVDPFQRSIQKQHALVLLQLQEYEDAALAAKLARLVDPAREPQRAPEGAPPMPPQPPKLPTAEEDAAERADCAAIEAEALYKAKKLDEARAALKLALKLDAANDRAIEIQKKIESENR
ncbi:MAG: tetratricopeptide repeat protein [Planctomycetota bacterium]